MWPFRKRPPAPEHESLAAAKPSAERLDDLEDAVRHLNRRFTRLQQQVTRWADQYDDEDTNDVEDEDDFDRILHEKRSQRG